MYHVLVVDDEPLMRTYLSRCIPACCGDFDVPAVSPDGVDVLRFFENVPSCYKTLMYHNHLVFSSDISLRTF